MEAVINNMSESRWCQVKKGIERGANCRFPENVNEVRALYDILYDLYKYKVKKPLPSWEFFKQFYSISGEGRLGVILLVEYQGKIIGGIFAPVTPGNTIYEWYVCGLDQQYKEVYPSVLATWAALEYAVNNNIPRFDFMGVGIPEREYGVRDFKIRFGGKLVNYGRFARINNKAFYALAEMGYNFLSLIKKI
jgi:lipid II:glycine glycyltransferase (peptidoglycan interpeptide bridge formation enzyme)